MAFFGFDASRHNTQAPGFSQAHDPFAGLAGGRDIDNALEFEDTYDGLGDQLQETGDVFNDDTFGGGATGGSESLGTGKVDNNFDFFGQTAKVADAMEEEHARFNLLQPVARAAPAAQPARAPAAHDHSFLGPSMTAAKPARSGYEKYNEPEPDMQVDAALWGVAPKKPATATPFNETGLNPSLSNRKVLSLEEVETAMRQKKQYSASVSATAQTQGYQQPYPEPALLQQPLQQSQPTQHNADYGYQMGMPPPGDAVQSQHPSHPVTILQRPRAEATPPSAPQALAPPQFPQQPQSQAQPTQILQNPNRYPSGDTANFGVPPPPAIYPDHPGHRRQLSSLSSKQIITHPSQVMHLSGEEKAAYLQQEAKRAKRNHKIFMLSKNNGLMTPQDKNFVTRIQLQQLVAATGNPNEHGTGESLKEDFYYQVLSQIRGTTRQHPSQPLNNFAQTYLFQTGSRFNPRRFNRDRAAESHMQRMDQQVQRAVEAAKNRPKNKQLVIEGTLGKISFSNAKTPKPLLSIKRVDNGSIGAASGAGERPSSAQKASGNNHDHAALDRKAVLSNIEKVYVTLMEVEDHDRKFPGPVVDANNESQVESHAVWAQTMERLTTKLWREIKVLEPIGEFPVHPFIAFLSVPKGKKAIPRVFRYLTHEQRTALMTIIVVHLDQLDVVHDAQVTNGGVQLNAALRESIELFTLTVINTLFNFMAELGLDIVTGVLGLITNLKVDVVAKSRVGASMLTLILSRAELIKQASGGTPPQWQAWDMTYTTFFDVLEGTLPHMFPGTVVSSDDMYVWQLLAALGIGANPDQQQRLVLAVKDRVMDTVTVAKTLPVDLATQRLQSVNLFMRSIGLDVELLQ